MKLPIPQVLNSSTSNLSPATPEPNIINLHNVENIEEWLKSDNNVYVGREGENEVLKNEDCKWGNPFTLREYRSRKKVVDLYRADISNNEELMAAIEQLHGKVLGCWCSPCQCHAEVLHELAGNCINYEDETSPSTNVQASSTTGNCISYEGETLPSTIAQASSPIPPSSPSDIGEATPPPTTTPDIKSLVERLNGVEGQLIFQKNHIQVQDDKIKQLEKRISHLEGDLTQTKARFC